MDTVPTEERSDDHPVRRAIAALRAYAGDLDRDRAGRLIPEWEDFRDLTAHDVLEVIFAFPPAPTQRPLRGGGMASGSMVLPDAES